MIVRCLVLASQHSSLLPISKKDIIILENLSQKRGETTAGNTISAIYEHGSFHPLEPPVGLAEQQQVQLFYIVMDETWPPEPRSLPENLRFVRETMGIWRVKDPAFRRWLAEDVNLFDV